MVELYNRIEKERILFEIIVINDNSDDGTIELLDNLSESCPNIRIVNNISPSGFGLAVRRGSEATKGEYVVIVMADASDDPDDIVDSFT